MNYEVKEWLDEVYVSFVICMYNKLYIKKYEQSISSKFLLGVFETEFNITKDGLEFGVEFWGVESDEGFIFLKADVEFEGLNEFDVFFDKRVSLGWVRLELIFKLIG